MLIFLSLIDCNLEKSHASVPLRDAIVKHYFDSFGNKIQVLLNRQSNNFIQVNPGLKINIMNSSNQCCGSGSGIRCLFDPGPGSGIRNSFFCRIPDPGSQPHIFQSLVTNFWVKSSIVLWKLAQFVFFSNNFQFCEICGYKNSFDNKFFFTPLFCCCFWIRDPEWVKIRIRDPG